MWTKKEATFEHVPPDNAFNSIPVKVFPPEATLKMMSGADSRLPWDLSGLSGYVNQRGSGDYYLCKECKNSDFQSVIFITY